MSLANGLRFCCRARCVQTPGNSRKTPSEQARTAAKACYTVNEALTDARKARDVTGMRPARTVVHGCEFSDSPRNKPNLDAPRELSRVASGDTGRIPFPIGDTHRHHLCSRGGVAEADERNRLGLALIRAV